MHDFRNVKSCALWIHYKKHFQHITRNKHSSSPCVNADKSLPRTGLAYHPPETAFQASAQDSSKAIDQKSLPVLCQIVAAPKVIMEKLPIKLAFDRRRNQRRARPWVLLRKVDRRDISSCRIPHHSNYIVTRKRLEPTGYLNQNHLNQHNTVFVDNITNLSNKNERERRKHQNPSRQSLPSWWTRRATNLDISEGFMENLLWKVANVKGL